MKSPQNLTNAKAPPGCAPTGGGPAGLRTDAVDPDQLEPLLERFLVSIVAMAGAQAGAVRVLTDDGTQMRLVAQLGLPAKVVSWGGFSLRCMCLSPVVLELSGQR